MATREDILKEIEACDQRDREIDEEFVALEHARAENRLRRIKFEGQLEGWDMRDKIKELQTQSQKPSNDKTKTKSNEIWILETIFQSSYRLKARDIMNDMKGRGWQSDRDVNDAKRMNVVAPTLSRMKKKELVDFDPEKSTYTLTDKGREKLKKSN